MCVHVCERMCVHAAFVCVGWSECVKLSMCVHVCERMCVHASFVCVGVCVVWCVLCVGVLLCCVVVCVCLCVSVNQCKYSCAPLLACQKPDYGGIGCSQHCSFV